MAQRVRREAGALLLSCAGGPGRVPTWRPRCKGSSADSAAGTRSCSTAASAVESILPGSPLPLPAAAVFSSQARRPGDAHKLHFCSLQRGRLVRLGVRKGRGQRCWLQSGPLEKGWCFLRPSPSHPPLHDPCGPFTCPSAAGWGYLSHHLYASNEAVSPHEPLPSHQV